VQATPTPIPVFLYHRVGVADDRFTVDADTFASHVGLIASSGRTFMTITELAECLRGDRVMPNAPFALTFDDGYADTRATIELAGEAGVKSTLYVTTGDVDNPGAVSRSDLTALADADTYVELGAHTVTHPRLDEVSSKAAELEITGSRDALQQVTGNKVSSFAYPHGAHTAAVRQIVIKAGFSSSAAVKNALSHSDDDPWAIARVTMTRDTSPSQVEALLRGEGAPLSWKGERWQTRGYRAVRRARRRLRVARPDTERRG
jgi:peptidoglycan/xylan/chitin deacetylase (PgdA/CDA1 family)